MKSNTVQPRSFIFSIYLANLFLSFHFYLILYINSSFLEQFFSAAFLSLLFIVGALFNLILLLNGPALLRKIGNYKLTLVLVFIEAIAVLGLAFSETPFLVALFFIIHQAVIMTILFDLDIFLEDYSSADESKTGGIRGLYLTIANITLVVSPTITGLILTNGDYFRVYLVSAIFLIPLFFTVKIGLKKVMPVPKMISLKNTLKKVLKNRDLYGVFMTQLILQLFYAWMIIYMPIHLHQNLGIPWTSLGVMFTIMLLPFILFEIPLGSLADKKIGEKEIMTAGFLIATFAVLMIPFIKEPQFWLWAGLLFLTRIGASFVEIASESYFFKHVNSGDSGIISLFRITRPLAFILTPAIAAVTLFLLNYFELTYGISFFVLAAITFYGIRYSLAITDTK